MNQSSSTVDTRSSGITPYQAIGGGPAVTLAVGNLYDYLLSDAELAGYFAGVDLARLRRHMAELLSTVLGGPGRYDIAKLAPAHHRLGITVGHFRRVTLYVERVLFDLDVPMDIIVTVSEVLASVESHIVAAPAG